MARIRCLNGVLTNEIIKTLTMIKLYTTLFLLAISSALTAQSTVATSPLFDTTTNSTWTHVFTAVKTSDSSSGEAQIYLLTPVQQFSNNQNFK